VNWPGNSFNFLEELGNILAAAGAYAHATWFMPVAGAVIWLAIAYAFHANLIRAATGAKPVARKDEPELYNLVENLAITAGLPVPQIEIMETGSLNAYAAGLSPGESVIAVTRGLMKTLDKHELEAVLAHEMSHIKNYDVRLMVIAAVFAGGLTLVGDLVIRFFRSGTDQGWFGLGRRSGGGSRSSSSTYSSNSRGKGGGLGPVFVAIMIAVAILMLVHFLAKFSRFAISRSREYVADAGAVELTKNPDALISALRKIAGNDTMRSMPSTVAAMMISADAHSLFATHPSINDRVAALRAFAGGRDADALEWVAQAVEA
jgi:heat shock protein HtpX